MEHIHISLGSIRRMRGQMSGGLTLLLVLRGSVALKSPDRNHALGENQLAVINCNDFYSLESGSSNVVLRVSPDRECLERLCPEALRCRFACSSANANASTEPLYDSLRKRITRMALLHYRHEEGYRLLLEAELLQVLHTLLLSFRAADGERKLNADPKLQPILERMEQNYREPMNLETTARQFYLSAPYLARLFRRELGMTFVEYLNTLRLSSARHELLHTDHSITRIALNSGFAGVQPFDRAFKKQFGCLPAEYRKQARPATADEEALIELETDSGGSLEMLARFVDAYDAHGGGELRREVLLGTPVGQFVMPELVVDAGEFSGLLRKDTQRQLELAVQGIRFTFVSFSGLFSTDLGPFFADSRLLQMLDVLELFDRLQALRLVPFVRVEPQREAAGIAPMLDALCRRFGVSEVERWRFELETEGAQPEQCREAAEHIWAACPRAAVGLFVNPRKLPEWLETGKRFAVLERPPAFIATASDPNSEAAPTDAFSYENFQKRYLGTTLMRLKAWMEESGISAPIYLTSWNTLTGRSIVEAGEFHRTALIIDAVLGHRDAVAGFGFRLNLQKRDDEHAVRLTYPLSVFLYQGIKRPLFSVLHFMSTFGNCVLWEEDGVLVTECEPGHYAVQLWHPCYLDPFQTLGNLRRDDYRRVVRLNLRGLPPGRYRVKTLYLDRDNGSTYRSWMKVDLSISLDEDVLDYLKNFSNPSLTLEERIVTDGFELEQSLALNGAAFWSIRRIPGMGNS